MKSLVLENKEQKLNSQSLFILLISLIFIISGNIYLLIAIFPYIFTRSNLDKLIYILPSILIYWINTEVFIQYIIYITLYFVLCYIVRNLKGNIIKVNQFYVGIYTFLISYNTSNDLYTSFSLFIIQMIIYQELMKSIELQKNHISSIVYTLITLNIMLFTIQYMVDYHEIFIVLGFIFICFKGNPLLSIVSLFFINLYSSFISYEIFVYLLLISLLKNQIGLMLLVYIGLFVNVSTSIYEVLILGLYLSFYLLLGKDENEEQEIKSINMKSTLHKQLNNFSLIFEHLSTYYENISSVESNFLKSMSNALKYTSKKCIQDENDKNYIRNKVISILEGYDIGYENVEIEIEDDGFMEIKLRLLNFNEKDVKEVLLPLLNHILPTEMECKTIHSSWLDLGVLNVEFVSTPPISIDAYADSTQLGNTCGDSFSIFQHSLKMYCLISDGMGRGVEASKISKCIVHLFQRMIFSNIQEIEAVNCINKLLLSDTYATCDILIFNRFRRTVNICKSAANPTYLIRNKEIYAIWGNSLPVGIVTHIDVDQIVVHVEKGDWFVMSSDGVQFDEILQWMKENDEKSSRKEVERFMNHLKQKARIDDSTILLAKVN